MRAIHDNYASRWCDSSRKAILACAGCTMVCGDWQCTHGVLPKYSLTWHEMLAPLTHALLHASRIDPAYARFALGTGDAFAFGMAHGHSMPMFRKTLPTSTRIFGFDSFHGLPAEDDEASKMNGWKQGAFKPKHSIWVTPAKLELSAGGRPSAIVVRPPPDFFSIFLLFYWSALRTCSPSLDDALLRSLADHATERPSPLQTPGFFDTSLTAAVVARHNMTRALYVDIDCDLHSSTTTALDWLLAHNLMRVGTLIGESGRLQRTQPHTYPDW